MNKKEAIIQFIKFGMVGALNTVLSYILNNSFYFLFEKTAILGNSVTVISQTSNFITFLITVFISYILNGKYVFEKNSDIPAWKSLLKVYASYSVTSLFLNGILIFIEVSVLGLPYYIATFVNLFFTIPINFILNKFWAYK
ncbi:MAG: GtrA family protein [Lachnospiraceae bacterium]|nr:GtrA family protein [Lachnospiraceae bacterium]